MTLGPALEARVNGHQPDTFGADSESVAPAPEERADQWLVRDQERAAEDLPSRHARAMGDPAAVREAADRAGRARKRHPGPPMPASGRVLRADPEGAPGKYPS